MDELFIVVLEAYEELYRVLKTHGIKYGREEWFDDQKLELASIIVKLSAHERGLEAI